MRDIIMKRHPDTRPGHETPIDVSIHRFGGVVSAGKHSGHEGE